MPTRFRRKGLFVPVLLEALERRIGRPILLSLLAERGVTAKTIVIERPWGVACRTIFAALAHRRGSWLRPQLLAAARRRSYHPDWLVEVEFSTENPPALQHP